ncbi:hypothetical protein HYX10_02980 [Candidatus Woesearchaeota archaeon]|nr:hypothetical protein [Candidatus Woesearchaeota archaeon]
MNQVDKLAKTLVSTGLAMNYAEALSKAREMLKVKEQADDITKLPKIEEIAEAGEMEKTLKELVEEDAEKIYNKKPTSNSR